MVDSRKRTGRYRKETSHSLDQVELSESDWQKNEFSSFIYLVPGITAHGESEDCAGMKNNAKLEGAHVRNKYS